MMPALLLAFPQAPAHEPGLPGPRAALAGMAGFQAVSRLDFGGARNRLTAVYVFPDRVRWHFESYGAARSEHQYFYRQGERVHQLASGAASQEIAGAERDVVLLQMELRRAAMLWPDGFDWSEEKAGERSAEVHADSCCRRRTIGTLVVSLEDGRPRAIEARDVDGAALETLTIRSWQERGGRTWPAVMALEARSGGDFVETVESIETRVHYLELSFLPPDRRALPESSADGPSVLARDLVAMTYAVHPLAPDVTWEEALARARDLVAAAAKELAGSGLAVDPVPTFELSGTGRPLRCLVRLSQPALAPPEGYRSLPERAGLFLSLQELAQVDAALVGRLRRATPEGARPGSPYLRLHGRPNLPVEVVLPLETPE